MADVSSVVISPVSMSSYEHFLFGLMSLVLLVSPIPFDFDILSAYFSMKVPEL